MKIEKKFFGICGFCGGFVYDVSVICRYYRDYRDY